MSELKILSIPEQIAQYLRGELAKGRWSGALPGRFELARQLGVGISSMEEALRQLERDGVLSSQGAGRMRQIVVSKHSGRRRLRIAIQLYEPQDLSDNYMIELLHLLWEAGHDAFFARSTFAELGMSVNRLARSVKNTEAEAWIMRSGSREVTEWFAAQPFPAFALFGRRRGIPIASVGPDKCPAYAAVTRRLVKHGHQKIVMLVRPDRRLPEPGAPERAFLAELAAQGIVPGSFHLPDWSDDIEGFHSRLESLFRVTPPTALIVDDYPLFVAAEQFLSRMRLRVPEDVSLVCTEDNPAFRWCRPTVATIRWDPVPVLRRVVGWTNDIAKGKADLRQTFTQSEFIDGGTIGPVKGR